MICDSTSSSNVICDTVHIAFVTCDLHACWRCCDDRLTAALVEELERTARRVNASKYTCFISHIHCAKVSPQSRHGS